MDAQTTSEALGLSTSEWGQREITYTGKRKALVPKWKHHFITSICPDSPNKLKVNM